MLRPSLPLALLFTVIACGARADAPNQVDSAPPVDSPPVPEPVAPTLDGDTQRASVTLRCEDGGTWMATYWVGPGARVVLSSESAGFVLPQVVAASGIRYTDRQPLTPPATAGGGPAANSLAAIRGWRG